MAEKTKEPTKGLYTRRALVLGGLQLSAFGVLLARLYQMQIIDADQYTTLSDDNRINYRLVPPPRGQIYDRFGYLVASNRDNLKVTLVPEDAGDIDRLLDRVAEIAPIEQKERVELLRRVRRQRGFVPVMVKENLTWAQFARLNVEGDQLPGVRPEAGYSRQYHFGRELAHVVGYVGPVNELEGADNPRLLMPGYEIGKSGVEKAQDVPLRGKTGIQFIEVNAGGRVIRQLNRNPTTTGQDVVLSIDVELQKFAQERLKDEHASAVVMDVHTGEVLAQASVPSYDANLFAGGMSRSNWSALIGDPEKPLLNRATQGLYPPGSTFKMVVALAALESGMIKPRNRVRCYGRFHLGKVSFRCWKARGHGAMDMHNAIKQSCDVYFYETAKEIGIEKIAEMAHKLGLGETFGPEFGDAKAGTIPTPGWKQGTLGEPWYPGETVIAGIGQGYVLSTTLQLAVYAARIANGGYAVMPRLVRSVGGISTLPDKLDKIDISDDSLAIIHRAMNAVVNEGGTAARSRFDVNGAGMAGKTGTSQVRSLTPALRAEIRRNRGVVPRKFKDHGLFVAYAPVDKPRYAAAVVVEHGGGGSKAAAPVVKDLLMKALETDVIGRPAFELETPPGRTAQDMQGSQDG